MIVFRKIQIDTFDSINKMLIFPYQIGIIPLISIWYLIFLCIHYHTMNITIIIKYSSNIWYHELYSKQTIVQMCLNLIVHLPMWDIKIAFFQENIYIMNILMYVFVFTAVYCLYISP